MIDEIKIKIETIFGEMGQNIKKIMEDGIIEIRKDYIALEARIKAIEEHLTSQPQETEKLPEESVTEVNAPEASATIAETVSETAVLTEGLTTTS